MDFISNQTPQIEEMLTAIGMKELDDLFSMIPSKLKLSSPPVDDGLSEYEGLRLMEHIASKNTFPAFDHYLGGGAYEHHVPALVAAVCSKSEFLTSYTPYQAEASQGMLQAIFEFQSAICTLTGMDVSNASVYDGASACAEALLMALRFHKTRKKVLIAKSLNPRYQAVIETYLSRLVCKVVYIPFLGDGNIDEKFLKEEMDQETAAVLLQNPNFFGVLDDVKNCFTLAKSVGATPILCADLLVYGLCPSASDLGAEIAVGECQSFGLPLEFGGPYAGYMACRPELIRQLPGRIVGETVDGQGRRGFVLTLQAREQHIRREKATSNICTNQALAALASLIAILWYGKEGIRELALTNYQRTEYLKRQLQAIKGFHIQTAYPTFNEFVLMFDGPLDKVLTHFRKFGIEPGIPLGDSTLLVAVTETKSQKQLDHYVATARSFKA
jgi:glycine dehydrogenase subunit 1